MNGFILSSMADGAPVRVVSHEPHARKKDWDEYQVIVEGRLTEDEMRARYQPGLKLNKGLGFYLQDNDTTHAGAGLTRAALTFRGLLERKVWGTPGAALATRAIENLKIGTSTTVPRANVLDVTPTFTAHVYDAAPPPYANIGKRVSTPSPVAGLVFPVTAGVGPWTFWDSYVPLINVLATAPPPFGGWALTDVQADSVEGDTAVLGSLNQLYGKQQTYTLFWPAVP